MNAGGFGFDDEPRLRPRRRVPWPLVGAVVLVLAFVVAVVIYENGRNDDISGDLDPVRTTTTRGGSPIPSGSGGSTGNGIDPAARSTCKGIPQTFPLSPRGCRISTPADLAEGEQVPAVILLHGFNSPSEQVAGNGRWREAAARDRFALVLPEGQGGSWNAGGCCGVARSAGIDDVGYLRGVLDQVLAMPEIDPRRVSVVGESNGGMMAYTFGCAESARVAAIVSVEGTPVSSCEPARPIPVMHVHGRDDLTVPYDGGQSVISWVLGTTFRSVPAAFDSIVAAMGCRAVSDTHTDDGVTTEDWTSCPDGVRGRLVSIDDLGHEWPRGEPYDATERILEFLGIGS